jgi:hypothetical protein
MSTNLPLRSSTDSADSTKAFFDLYGGVSVQFAATDVDAAINFFKDKGFEDDAAVATAQVILKQCRLENVPVYEVLDTLAALDALNISSIVGQILNNDRQSTSTLGFRTERVSTEIVRNIRA